MKFIGTFFVKKERKRVAFLLTFLFAFDKVKEENFVLF